MYVWPLIYQGGYVNGGCKGQCKDGGACRRLAIIKLGLSVVGARPSDVLATQNLYRPLLLTTHRGTYVCVAFAAFGEKGAHATAVGPG